MKTAGSRGADPYTLVLDFTTRRRTEGDFWHAPSSCMVPMTLVSFTDVRPCGAQRRAGHVHVHDGVHGVLGQHAGDGGLPYVRPYEIGSAQMVGGRHGVHADHPVHVRITLDAPYETASELPGHSGDEHDLPQDQRLPLA